MVGARDGCTLWAIFTVCQAACGCQAPERSTAKQEHLNMLQLALQVLICMLKHVHQLGVCIAAEESYV